MRLLSKTTGVIALANLAASVSLAQSLDPANPAPLKPGVNVSSIDVGMSPHYWTFIVEKGNAKINLTFRAHSILGAPFRTQLAFNLYDIQTPGKKITNVIESKGEEVLHTFSGPVESRCQMVIEVVPPESLVRAGGEYQVQAVTGITFLGAGVPSAPGAGPGGDPILNRHFRALGCNNDVQCGIRFLPDGAIALGNGGRGSWRLFDPARSVYVIVIGNQRQSLKWKPGVGLVRVQEDGMVEYQEVR
jgi:hypothetical protein